MKKGIVAILVLLAVIVLASPAIVGRLAEEKMDENLNWAAAESGELTVTSEHFDRGWFSSEGRHRVELGEGQIMAALRSEGGPDNPDELPALIINTRIDHGLIPVGSVGSEQPSLSPGLGNAESTLQVEMPDGETFDLPGKIFSKIGLGGQLQSTYSLGPGSRSFDDGTVVWGTTDINVETDPANGVVVFDGTIGSLSVEDSTTGVSLGALMFNGRQQPTRYGFAIGDVELSLNDLEISGTNGGAVREMAVTGTTTLDNGEVGGDATMSMTLEGLPQFGELEFDMALSLAGADATSLGRVTQLVEAAGPDPEPMALYASVEKDLKTLFAHGFDLNFNQFDLALPQGNVTSIIKVSISEEDPATFAWTSLLLNTEASVNLSIPAELFEAMAQGSPEAAMLVGGGYLLKRDDAYVMDAQLKKGLLTVNGAPIPIPLGMP